MVRQAILSARDALTVEQRSLASARIAEKAAAILPATGTIALYAAKGSEVGTSDLDALLRARGQTIAYPRIIPGSRVLAFHVVAPGELRLARFGILEPTADATPIAIDAIAAFVIPGLGFDRRGARLGWGMGHYDTTLEANRALRVGLAFECQMRDEIPVEPHDLLLDAVVTEA